MDTATVELQVREILADKLNIDVSKINLNSLLIDDLGMDSFAAVETVFEFEDRFQLKIPDADIEKAKTVKDMVDYIVARTAAVK